MQLGIRLHDTAPAPLVERLAKVGRQGFTCVHLALSKVLEDFPKDPGALTPGFAMYLKKLFQRCDIDIAVLGCYLNPAHPDPVQLKAVLNTYMAHIRFASVLSCGVVGTETGAPNTGYQYEPACRSKEALAALIRNLAKVVSYAETMGGIIAIEPVRDHIVYSPRAARQVLDAIKSPNLQIIFDPVNLLGMDNYLEQAQVVEEAVTLLGDAIAVVHMKDFVIKDGRITAVAAGSGNLDYRPILDFIKSKKPMIQCTLENTKPENAVAAKEYIQSLWDRA
jgi:L-ribulose-5-phosphate 3-epimerase